MAPRLAEFSMGARRVRKVTPGKDFWQPREVHASVSQSSVGDLAIADT